MIALFLILLSTPALASSADHPKTYLLSIAGLPVRDTRMVNAFSIETWGVKFNAVCRIPEGWRMKAGNSLSPNGELSGEGSQGVTWF